MTNPVPKETKARLRKQFRSALGAVSPTTYRARSALLCQILADWLGALDVRNIGLFSPLRTEVDLTGLHDLLPVARLYYPRIHGSELRFHRVGARAELAPGPFGIREPVPALHPCAPSASLEVFLCPGLAFSATGIRLGRGGGYYDRALSGAGPEALLVGVGLEIQTCDALPWERHDITMTHLATEAGIRPCSP